MNVFRRGADKNKTKFTAPDDDRVPASASALIFHPDGSYELWLTKESGEDGAATRGAMLAAALSVAIESDDDFLPTVLEKLKAEMEKRGTQM